MNDEVDKDSKSHREDSDIKGTYEEEIEKNRYYVVEKGGKESKCRIRGMIYYEM